MVRPGTERRRDLLRLSRPLHWRSTSKFDYLLGRLVGGIEWCPNRSGSDSVHSDTAIDQMGREGTRKGMNPSFGHRIIEQIFIAQEACHRTGHDYRTTVLQMRDSRLGHEKIAI